ncbi:strawberry notch C-terminal domain-containing protein [Leptolyngbya sp. BC1307]|uniref:strawberry notch C-terminal domain-containing protein n=1 Tax=Leptolyngbya sp. BC1307 TaxID=2029589 RepID=UPI001140D5CE|nr:strawberry notch C-terminal domain-containing protein [Leptolyngbya sp. BC1307]
MSLSLTSAYAEHFLLGGRFNRIVEARQFAAEMLGTAVLPGSALAKQVDEAIEAAIVRVAATSIHTAQTTHEAYDTLIDLLQRQPRLGVRSSTSVLQQAYSTPVPIAYLASVLGGITSEKTVYEPTAGNGSLLIGANPRLTIANELNPDRIAELQTRGYSQLTQKDAIAYSPNVKTDVVVCNPPFGTVKNEQGRTRRFPMYDTWTSQIDQAIALKALTTMKDHGSAVLILGGKLGKDPAARSDRYNRRETRAFYHLLYRHYNVTQHLSLSGDLYRKQGAGFPIDLIVISGRGQSQRPLPAAELPPFYTSYHSLKEIIPNESIQSSPTNFSRPLSELPGFSESLDARATALSLHRLRTPNPHPPGRENLSGTHTSPTRRHDSRLGQSDFPVRDPKAVEQHARSTRQRSAHADSDSQHGQRLLATGMGQSPDSRQLEVSGTDVALRHHVPNEADHRQRSNVSRPDRNARRHHPRRMANDTHALTTETEETTDSPLQPRQVPYISKSQGQSSETLIPYNMANAAQLALERFEGQHGNIDEYLRSRLGYSSTTELHRYFSAEQVDASALAISNIERGSGFITGDQTGIGKGRICASIIRYARQTGKIAIFVTKDKPLYADMMRDVHDIGLRSFSPFVTDSHTEIPLANGGLLTTPGSAQQKKAMMEIIRRKQLTSHSAVFTTYSQLQTVKKKEPLRREFLRAIAPNAYLILDEAHQAGGSSQNGWKETGPPDRAEFVRELIDLSKGVFYSSATYAKRPDVMDLYARRTDLRLGVQSMASLENILYRGGVPLQQIIASKLVAASHMLRRERSYEGVSFQAQTVSVDKAVADQFSAAMRAIRDFDRAKQAAVKTIKDELKAQAKAFGTDTSVGEVGAKSTNFTSLMHNCIEQGLLAQKADATVRAALSSLEQGEKPVIAVANTMGSFIKAYADAHDLEHGNDISLSFGDLLERYLERSRDVLIRDYRAQSTRHRLTDGELGIDGVSAYEDALECIQAGDFYSVPISPIDYIEQQLERAGYRVAEVTGRKVGLAYSADGSATYKIRPVQETTAKGKINAVAQFNAGQADVILLNCSGSTGISLHASEKFADQRPRHMIVAQAERDINVFMQMLGRIHRTGQVVRPRYTLLIGDIPAEKRPGALLCRKMASLNANTTAARDSDISLQNVVDFMNEYGEQVVTDLLKDDPDLNAQLDFPLAQVSDSDADIALVRKVTGRIPLLPIAEQEAVYSLIEGDYQELVQRAQAMGDNNLAAGQLDLDAKTVARAEVVSAAESLNSQVTNAQANQSSEFTGAVYLEVVDAKVLAKPMTQLQVIDAVRQKLKLPPALEVDQHNRTQTLNVAQQQRAATVDMLKMDTLKYRLTTIATKRDPKAREKFAERLDTQLQQVTQALEKFVPGRTLQVRTPQERLGESVYGVVESVEQKRKSANPAAPHSWKLRILIAGPARELVIPLSNVNTDRVSSLQVQPTAQTQNGEDIYQLFDEAQAVQREHCQIFTGNLIKAFEKYPAGKFVNYTDDQGKVRQGLMMPKGFELIKALENEPVALPEPAQVRAFITTLTDGQGAVKTLDELLTLKKIPREEGFILETPKAKGVGGKYYLDQALLTAVEGDFYSVGDRMTVPVTSDQLDAALEVLMKQRHYALAAFEFQDVARDYLGISLPSLTAVNEAVGKPPPDEPLLSQVSEPQVLSPSKITRPPIQLARSPSGKRATLEDQVISFLQEAGLWETVQKDQDFHFRILNEPYIPLVIERLGNDLCLTHYLSQNGDTYIDTEMVFAIEGNDQIKFKEVAVPNALQGGELRGHDSEFAKLFAQNIVAQGFVEAAQKQFQSEAQETPTSEPPVRRIAAIAEPSLKEVADEVREADLEGVAVELGLERDPHDKHKWRDGDHIISISDRLFMDWLADKGGGGGAIDLVMHVRECDFKEAVEWLSGRSFSQTASISHQHTEPKEPRPLVMPQANERRWEAVQRYLVETRKLPLALVERLHEKSLIYADDFQNVVFVRHGMADGQWRRGESTGASLRGTWGEQNAFRGMAQGTMRDKGWFWLGTGSGQIARVLLTESPIDAMSLAMLDRQNHSQHGVTIYLSVDGAGALPVEALRGVMQRGGNVVIGFDADQSGELMAWRVARQLPSVERLYPHTGKDWNEQLMGAGQPTHPDQQLAELWQWYAAACSVARSEQYLNRIGEVATAFIKGNPLSVQAKAAMKQDFNHANKALPRSVECGQ